MYDSFISNQGRRKTDVLSKKIPADKGLSNSTLLKYQSENTTQDKMLQFKKVNITREFRSNLWSEELRNFFNGRLQLLNLYLTNTDFVGGYWRATFTYDSRLLRAPQIDAVIAQVPLNRPDAQEEE